MELQVSLCYVLCILAECVPFGVHVGFQTPRDLAENVTALNKARGALKHCSCPEKSR